MELTRVEGDWKVHWKPSVIHPRLGAQQHLEFNELRPDPAPVLGRDGRQLMGPEELVTVVLDPEQAGDVHRVVAALAGPLGTIDPVITEQSILDGLAGTPPGQPYSVVTLRRADYERVKPQIYELPGVRFPVHEELLAAESDYGSQVLPGIGKYVEDKAAGEAGWSVVTVNPAGREVRTLHEVRPKPAEAVTTTLSDRIQQAAEQAVDPVPKAAMLVAMQPSTGDVLAVAQNRAADAKGPLALIGQYPPGSTFKVVTAAAAIEAGRVGINTPVACPATKVFNGRTVPNDKKFDLGTVPLRTAFAESCNTTFAQLGVDLPADAPTEAARRLGLGVDFVTPGITTITGKVPPAEGTVGRAANAFGQGTVLASPFGMALVTASVVRGSIPAPKLIEGTRTEVDAAPRPSDPRTLEQVRSMMREVVRSGTATQLAGMGEVGGKTGTAQFGDGTRSHGWFVGYRGDLAFAVLITDAGASAPAVDLAKRFLSATG